ncbi:hypothetical protein [Sporosarcina sp. FA9]|uniref:hypothetical protein n=1 Tax=Sporosarcina sp. FA9 TaxID=3413030 RepID=UPI003F65D73A
MNFIAKRRKSFIITIFQKVLLVFEEENGTLKLLYKSEETSDYSNLSLKNELFNKINLEEDYEVIKTFNNGNETHFGKISGNN